MEPQVLRQWDDVAKKYTDTVAGGINIAFTFDGAEDVLVVKSANKQDIANDRGYILRKP